MTFKEFTSKYDGKAIDFDGSFGNQCMDLYRQYVKEVLEFPQSPPVVGAADVWDTYLKSHYTKVENTPEGVPTQGDIVIWKRSPTLPFGHIAIFDTGDTTSFTSFDQNWPVGSLCHFQKHSYLNVAGWLVPVEKQNEKDNNENMTPQTVIPASLLPRWTSVGGNPEGEEIAAIDGMLYDKTISDTDRENLRDDLSHCESSKAQYAQLLQECMDKPPTIIEKTVEKIVYKDREERTGLSGLLLRLSDALA